MGIRCKSYRHTVILTDRSLREKCLNPWKNGNILNNNNSLSRSDKNRHRRCPLFPLKGAAMKTRLMLLAFVLLINNGLAWGGGGRDISNPAGRSSSKSEASDTENTERNVRDKSGATLTP